MATAFSYLVGVFNLPDSIVFPDFAFIVKRFRALPCAASCARGGIRFDLLVSDGACPNPPCVVVNPTAHSRPPS
ncbi:hypothetical protein WDV93_10000, partial [Pantoea ananatis]